MSETIESLLTDRATAMATHDGTPVGVIHIHGAANQLQAELLAARDKLIHASAQGAPAVPAEEAGAEEEAASRAEPPIEEVGGAPPAEPPPAEEERAAEVEAPAEAE